MEGRNEAIFDSIFPAYLLVGLVMWAVMFLG